MLLYKRIIVFVTLILLLFCFSLGLKCLAPRHLSRPLYFHALSAAYSEELRFDLACLGARHGQKGPEERGTFVCMLLHHRGLMQGRLELK